MIACIFPASSGALHSIVYTSSVEAEKYNEIFLITKILTTEYGLAGSSRYCSGTRAEVVIL